MSKEEITQPSPENPAKKAATEKAAIVAIFARGQAEKIFADLSDETLIKYYKMIQNCTSMDHEEEKFNQLLMVAKVDALTKVEQMLKARGIDCSKYIVPESLVW